MQFIQTAMERARKVQLVILDVDGVLTDGQIQLTDTGELFKNFNCQDGFGISLARKCGLKMAIITGRQSSIVEYRANELSIDALYQGQRNKLGAFAEIQKKYKLQPEEFAYIGDDIIDLPVMTQVGFAAAPKNAVAEVRERAHFIADRCGGDGAVRQVMEFILKAQGHWDQLIYDYTHAKPFEHIEQ